MAEKAKAGTCRSCGKKRKLDPEQEGLCGKCWDESGAGPEAEAELDALEQEEAEACPPDVMAAMQKAMDAETPEEAAEANAEFAKARGIEPAPATMYGPVLGYQEFPSVLLIEFLQKLPKDEVTPEVPELIGIATTPEAKEKLVRRATNGRRLLRVVPKEVQGRTLFGLYAF